MEKIIFSNLSQLKKGLQEGMEFKFNNDDNEHMCTCKVIEVLRNSFCISYSHDRVGVIHLHIKFPKASQCVFTDDGFKLNGVDEFRYV